MFKGNLNDSSRYFCSFTTEDEDFGFLGLHQFTIDHLYNHCKRNISDIEKTSINSTLKTFFKSAKTATQADFKDKFKALFSSVYYYKFSMDTKKYEKTTITADRMFELINGYRDLKTRQNYDDTVTRKAIEEIQNSSYQCLQIDLKVNQTIGTLTVPVKLKAFFKENVDVMTGERVMAQKTSNVMTGIPRRATGAKYGAKNTNNADGRQDNVGVYSSPSEGGDKNMSNMVSGPLKMSFNKSLGVWESGTQQMLAKLLTDVDKASIKNTAISPAESATGKNFYDPASDYYLGGFTTGIAMPLSMEDGNPHLFGPNCVSCSDSETKIEKIRVVNRAPRSFKAGATVMCSHIDGEWIIQDFGFSPDAAAPAAAIGPWSFIKVIANSDSYFKDARYINDDGTVNQDFAASISPDVYETKSRNRFYGHLEACGPGDLDGIPAPTTIGANANTIINTFVTSPAIGDNPVTANTLNKLCVYNHWPSVSGKEIDTNPNTYKIIKPSGYDFLPSKNYLVSTIFDQLGPAMCGNSSTNFIQKTNVSNDPTSDVGKHSSESFPFFWGPVFSDGYQVSDVSRVKTYSTKPTLAITNNNNYFTVGTNLFPFNPANAFKNGSTVDMFLIDDTNVKELPAEVGVLSSGNPIEDITQTIVSYGANGNFAEAMSTLLGSSSRLAWITEESGNDVYNLHPISNNKLQFSPLQAEFAGHADLHSKFAKRAGRDFFTYTRDLLLAGFVATPHWFGKMFTRFVGDTGFITPTYPTCDVYDQTSHTSTNDFKNVPYDCYIKTKVPTSKPVGAPKLFYDTIESQTGGNLIGVIAAKNKLTRKNGGILKIELKQEFGFQPFRTVAGGQDMSVSLIGYFFAGSFNDIKQYSTPQWGSTDDKYDSFGTTAMHVRVFDQWPNEQTIYDARFFSVLHFNPGKLFSIPASEEVGLTDSELTTKFKDQYTKWNTTDDTNYRKLSIDTFNYKRKIDKADESVDFRVPTYGWPLLSSINANNADNAVIPAGTKIDKSTVFRPEKEWRINPIRRGQLLTKGGFRYFRSIVGLKKGTGEEFKIVDPGLGFKDGQLVQGTKGVILKLKADSDGKITDFEFSTDGDNNQAKGEGFLPSDFARAEKVGTEELTGYFLNIAGTKSAKIYFKYGEVYQVLMHDEGPQERCPIQRVSASSNRGEKDIDLTTTTELNIQANSDGKYDAFYFFHNDITHTLLFSYSAQIPGFHQYVTMTIS
jgi:DNA-directed RNA polymerase subunit K/omega